ncbi:hypothetical protein PFISCL1PPCAC_18070, partial [Pristionchus fissidentatus]
LRVELLHFSFHMHIFMFYRVLHILSFYNVSTISLMNCGPDSAEIKFQTLPHEFLSFTMPFHLLVNVPRPSKLPAKKSARLAVHERADSAAEIRYRLLIAPEEPPLLDYLRSELKENYHATPFVCWCTCA